MYQQKGVQGMTESGGKASIELPQQVVAVTITAKEAETLQRWADQEGLLFTEATVAALRATINSLHGMLQDDNQKT